MDAASSRSGTDWNSALKFSSAPSMTKKIGMKKPSASPLICLAKRFGSPMMAQNGAHREARNEQAELEV